MSAINELIDKYMRANPRQPQEVGYYKRVAEVFKVHPENIRTRWRMLKKSIIVENGLTDTSTNYIYVDTDKIKYDYSYIYDANGATLQATIGEKVESLEDLIRICKIDTDKYDIVTYEIKTYNAWIKNPSKEIETKQLYSVRAQLKARKVDTDIKLQKDYLLDEIKKYDPFEGINKVYKVNEGCADMRNHPATEKDSALEINIPDLHIGKLAWGKESGEDYDIKIAVERYKKAVLELIGRVNVYTLEKIILPVGNDMINVDNNENTTTSGTAVTCDSRFAKMFQTAKELLVETIDYLSLIAPVEVIIVPGNHDRVAMFTLGEVLSAWYNGNDKVSVTNTPTPRKYITYGSNLIMYTHGDREKLNDLGIICATEQPELWAATKFRRVHVGHFHHSKQIKFTDVQEYPGFTVKILNSLSSNDDWHAEKGFMSLKGAEAFLYHRTKGLIANYYYIHA